MPYADLSALPSLERAAEAKRLQGVANAEQAHYARVRAEALREANDGGMTLEQIADHFGVSVAAISAAITPLRKDDASLINEGCRLLIEYADMSMVPLDNVMAAQRTPDRSLGMKAKRFAVAAKSARFDFDDMDEEDAWMLRKAIACANAIAYPSRVDSLTS